MNFNDFLKAAKSATFWQERNNICFVSNMYQGIWFSFLFNALRKKSLLSYPYQRLFLDTTEKTTLYGALNQSILGMYSFFWLGDLTEEKETNRWLEFAHFVLNYKGPHIISYFVNNSSKLLANKSIDAIVLPTELSLSQVIECAAFFDITFDTKKMALLKKIIPPEALPSLDFTCMLVTYLELISTKYLYDYMPFLESISGTSPSLTLLAEQFFSKNAHAFFQTWSKLSEKYPEVFWIAFWSEQIWRAYHVIENLNQKNFAQAKRMSFRLPYAFIKRDWQQTNPHSLLAAYEFLYAIDYAIKNGSSFCSLDLFYMKYFTSQFNQGASS